jgi:hypothetical protein
LPPQFSDADHHSLLSRGAGPLPDPACLLSVFRVPYAPFVAVAVLGPDAAVATVRHEIDSCLARDAATDPQSSPLCQMMGQPPPAADDVPPPRIVSMTM